MTELTKCAFCRNRGKTITSPKCPKFEQSEDDEDYVICVHVLIEDGRGFCEINYDGESV